MSDIPEQKNPLAQIDVDEMLYCLTLHAHRSFLNENPKDQNEKHLRQVLMTGNGSETKLSDLGKQIQCYLVFGSHYRLGGLLRVFGLDSNVASEIVKGMYDKYDLNKINIECDLNGVKFDDCKKFVERWICNKLRMFAIVYDNIENI